MVGPSLFPLEVIGGRGGNRYDFIFLKVLMDNWGWGMDVPLKQSVCKSCHLFRAGGGNSVQISNSNNHVYMYLTGNLQFCSYRIYRQTSRNSNLLFFKYHINEREGGNQYVY